jgi:hypothetical protein
MNQSALVTILRVPTVLRQGGFDIRIYNRDHPPMHVHVVKAGVEVVVDLEGPSIRDNWRMSRKDARKGLDLVVEHQDFL